MRYYRDAYGMLKSDPTDVNPLQGRLKPNSVQDVIDLIMSKLDPSSQGSNLTPTGEKQNLSIMKSVLGLNAGGFPTPGTHDYNAMVQNTTAARQDLPQTYESFIGDPAIQKAAPSDFNLDVQAQTPYPTLFNEAYQQKVGIPAHNDMQAITNAIQTLLHQLNNRVTPNPGAQQQGAQALGLTQDEAASAFTPPNLGKGGYVVDPSLPNMPTTMTKQDYINSFIPGSQNYDPSTQPQFSGSPLQSMIQKSIPISTSQPMSNPQPMA